MPGKNMLKLLSLLSSNILRWETHLLHCHLDFSFKIKSAVGVIKHNKGLEIYNLIALQTVPLIPGHKPVYHPPTLKNVRKNIIRFDYFSAR